MRKILFIGLLIVLGASECKEPNMQDDELSIVQHDYNGNKLKLNGFYYIEVQESYGLFYNRYFFYRNGVVRYAGVTEDLGNSNDFLSGSSKFHWGLFEIIQDTIRFEKWYPSSGGPLRAYVREGPILNDSTFHINSSYRMTDGEKTEIKERDELYHFYEYSPKPDSTTHYLN